MTGNEYQKSAMRTNDGKATERLIDKLGKHVIIHHNNFFGKEVVANIGFDLGGIFDAALGLSGEVGELNDLLKKWVFHEKPIDVEHAKKELGDIMWYVAMMCQSFGWELDDILQINVDKLKERYPKGFDVKLANCRKEGDL
jgi:NTP pyrophosphatase (non-canonical NTP hydrolase)